MFFYCLNTDKLSCYQERKLVPQLVKKYVIIIEFVISKTTGPISTTLSLLIFRIFIYLLQKFMGLILFKLVLSIEFKGHTPVQGEIIIKFSMDFSRNLIGRVISHFWKQSFIVIVHASVVADILTGKSR